MWQAGPMGSDRYTSESRSQSANTRATLMKCPDVSPLHHRPCSGGELRPTSVLYRMLL